MSVKFDHDREERTGISEVILAEPKSLKDLEIALDQALEGNSRVLITRIQENQLELLNRKCERLEHAYDDFQRTMMIWKKNWDRSSLTIGIVSAGTSDRRVVEEVAMCVDFFGYQSVVIQDVGVAGIHRLTGVLEQLKEDEIKCLIAIAGHEGALFPVISGLVKVPVIAVPVSTGYGFGGQGKTALRVALQSCAPGIATVNIDNGFGAAALAAKILKLFD